LREQAEDSILAFHAAWRRLDWILPIHRAFALNALWWDLQLDVAEELGLTLLMCDGLSPSQIATLRWVSSEVQGSLLPRTRSLLAKHRRTQHHVDGEDRVFGDEGSVIAMLERGWERLREHARRARPRVHLPEWSRIPNPNRSEPT
jgi:hypothetical protein